jgi:hypothetical protein
MKKLLITLSLAAMPNKLFSSTLRLICLALLISGCSINSSDEVVVDHTPKGVLGSMQGSWEPIVGDFDSPVPHLVFHWLGWLSEPIDRGPSFHQHRPREP